MPRYRWQPEPHQIIYRANILIAETDEKVQLAFAQYPRQAVFPLKAGVGAALLELDQRNVASEYAVNWRPTFPTRFGAKRLEQQRDWRILEATIGVLS